MRKASVWLGLAVLAAAMIACGGAGQATPEPAVERATATQAVIEPTATAEPTLVTTRCEPADPELLALIAQRLTVQGGGDLRNGWMVRSGDFEKVYFVAAEITGEGMEDVVGLWSTNEPTHPGILVSVNGFANEFSDWLDGRKSDAQLSTADDGAAEAVECVKAGR